MCSSRALAPALLACCCLLAFAHAAPAADVSAAASDERAELLRLTAARTVIAQQFKADSEQCQRRFFVNACLDEAKSKRSAALRPLEAREAVLDANQRRARAEAQRERATQREREFAEAEGRQRTAQLLAAQVPARPLAAKAEAASGSVGTLPAKQQTMQRSQQIKAGKAQDEAKHRELQKANYQSDQALRQQEAERRRLANEAKLKGKKAPLALPIPSSAEIEAAGSAAPPAKR
jgi:colicin import membrane protein